MKFMQLAFRNCAYFDLELPGTSVSKPLKFNLDPTFQLDCYVDFLKYVHLNSNVLKFTLGSLIRLTKLRNSPGVNSNFRLKF